MRLVKRTNTPSINTSSIAALALAPLLVIALTACGTEENNAATEESASTDGAAATDGADEAGDSDGNNDEDTTSSGAVSAAQSCFPGTWALDVATYEQSVADAPQIQNAAGLVTVTFAEDGTVATQYDDWAYDVIVTMGSVTNTDSMVRNGTDTGTYEISDDGVAVISDTAVESEVTTTSTKYSQTTTTTESTGFSMFRTAPMTCDGDEITVSVRDDRSVTLHRA